MDHALAILALLDKRGSARLAERHGRAVNARASRDGLERPLVVFDIDATLVTDDSRPIDATVRLFRKLRAHGARLVLITARHPNMRAETERELRGIGLDGWDELLISPQSARTDMAAVGAWKQLARRQVAIRHGVPVALTIGDQWTDIVAVDSADDLEELDAGFLGFGDCAQYVLVRPNDGISLLGLKLQYQ